MNLYTLTDSQLADLKYETTRWTEYLAYFRRWGKLAIEEDRLKAIEAEQLRRDGVGEDDASQG